MEITIPDTEIAITIPYYKKELRLHYVNKLSEREIADSRGDCGKTSVNEFLKRFRECQELTYPLSEDITNEYIEGLLYRKPGVSATQQLYRDFDKEEVYKVLAQAAAVFGFMNAGPGVIAAALLFLAGFFIYGINSLVRVFATDIGGRTFGGTATGVLDCAAYIGASVQALFFGSVLTNSVDWKFVFLCIAGVLGVMVVAAVMAGVERKNRKHR